MMFSKSWPFFSRSVETKSASTVSEINLGDPENFNDFAAFELAPTYQFALQRRALSATDLVDLHNRSSAVKTAVSRIANACGTIPIVLQSTDKTKIDEHQILDRFRRPNPAMGYALFIEELISYYLIHGRTFMSATGGIGRPPVELWPSNPVGITTSVATLNTYPDHYEVTYGPVRAGYQRRLERGRWRYLDGTLRELIPIQAFTPNVHKTFGQSVLQAAALDVRQQIEGRIHNLALLGNGARPTLAVVFKNDPSIRTQEQFDERKAKIERQFAGAGNAGQIAVFSAEDLDMKELGINNKDMDFAVLDDKADRAIFRAFKIPLPLVTNEAATFSNYETAREVFYDDAVLPIFRMVLNEAGRYLFPRYGMDPSDFQLVPDLTAIEPLVNRSLRQLKERASNGLETINELRDEIPGRDDVEGGDEIYIQASLVPLSEASTEGELMAPEPLTDDPDVLPTPEDDEPVAPVNEDDADET